MAISVREMDVFRCVMQSGSVTNAAAALNISQPAVSRMLQQAEERLGFSLFEREKKRLKPTTEAQTLFAEVVNVFAAIEHTQRLAVELRDGQAHLSDEHMVDLVLTIAFYCGVVRVLATMKIDNEPYYKEVLQQYPISRE